MADATTFVGPLSEEEKRIVAARFAGQNMGVRRLGIGDAQMADGRAAMSIGMEFEGGVRHGVKRAVADIQNAEQRLEFIHQAADKLFEWRKANP